MTKKQNFIHNYLFDNKDRFVSPTEIGKAYGKFKFKYGFVPRWYHSSVASKTCLKLVEWGVAERNKKGHYKFIAPY